jgi:hypothetical protein
MTLKAGKVLQKNKGGIETVHFKHLYQANNRN